MEIGVGTVGVVARWVEIGVGTVGVVVRWRLVLELWEWWLGGDWCWNCGSGG